MGKKVESRRLATLSGATSSLHVFDIFEIGSQGCPWTCLKTKHTDIPHRSWSHHTLHQQSVIDEELY
jgi:hypothetical protein